MSFPSPYRGPGETPRSGCGCLLVAFLVAAIVIGALVAMAVYATNVVDGQKK